MFFSSQIQHSIREHDSGMQSLFYLKSKWWFFLYEALFSIWHWTKSAKSHTSKKIFLVTFVTVRLWQKSKSISKTSCKSYDQGTFLVFAIILFTSFNFEFFWDALSIWQVFLRKLKVILFISFNFESFLRCPFNLTSFSAGVSRIILKCY